MRSTRIFLLWLSLLGALQACAGEPVVIRVGHFPNITHAQALVAHQLSRRGEGWFESRLGAGVRLEWYLYNAGPSATEAIFARSIDLSYIGPNPALNAHFQSEGAEIRVVAGAMRGGAALVVRPDSGIRTAADFRGKRLATPQLGNTQDVAARSWLTAGGLKVRPNGGDVQVVPTANPDQLAQFQQGRIEGVWTVEPWVSRLEREAGGIVLLEQPEDLTTILISRAAFLQEQPELLARFVGAHRELTAWIAAHPQEAQALVAAEMKDLTRTRIDPALLAAAWKRLRFDARIATADFVGPVRDARAAGFLRRMPDLSALVAPLADAP